MPLPECSVLWPTNRAEKGIDAVKKAAIDAKITSWPVGQKVKQKELRTARA